MAPQRGTIARSRFTFIALAAALVASSAGLAANLPDAAAAVTRGVDAAGSAPVGSASYPVPQYAVFASPTGVNTAAGTAAAPVRTLARAIALTPAGGTVVLKAGSYPEKIALYKSPTIQSHRRLLLAAPESASTAP